MNIPIAPSALQRHVRASVFPALWINRKKYRTQACTARAGFFACCAGRLSGMQPLTCFIVLILPVDFKALSW
ncbi:hypothetical protein ACT91Q_13350 [Brevibacillus thermoruber]|jgi:hypothetical protein|uniref:hypothetical protein n=1 Tax=Brevibacillus TaxID=55080 RepID=UPI00117E0C29|nr:hypothetical protein [Brevibacillus sp. LEMMJ03]TRY27027.1 hypothetical protein FOI68_05525 [Brevibacillus sp. LEMMJ03]